MIGVGLGTELLMSLWREALIEMLLNIFQNRYGENDGS